MVQFQLDFATIASALSIIIMIATLVGLAVKAGERREAIKQMKKEIEDLKKALSNADTQTTIDGKLLSAIKATLDGLVGSVKEVRDLVLTHIAEGA